MTGRLQASFRVRYLIALVCIAGYCLAVSMGLSSIGGKNQDAVLATKALNSVSDRLSFLSRALDLRARLDEQALSEGLGVELTSTAEAVSRDLATLPAHPDLDLLAGRTQTLLAEVIAVLGNLENETVLRRLSRRIAGTFQPEVDAVLERWSAEQARTHDALEAGQVGFPMGLLLLLGILHVVLFHHARQGALVRADRLSEVFESMRTGLLVLDEDGVCVQANDSLCKMLEMPDGWSPVGDTIVNIITELADRGDYGPRIPPCQPIDTTIYKSPEFEEIYLETPLGRVVAVSVSKRPSLGWILMYTDVTWMKKQTRMLYNAQRELAVSEAKAKRLAKQADAANHAKSAFLASMSHEIRTPMNGIIGMSEMICETDLTSDQRSYADTIRQSGEALLVIVNDILDFSKIEAGRMTLESAPFNLMTTIEDVLMLVLPKAREKDLELTLNYDLDLPVGFRGDAPRLRQILINLIGNAVKFTLEGRVSVAVTGSVSGDVSRLQVAVEDTGIGIPEDNLDKVFGEFMQVDQTSSRKFEGTGLGLAITKRLISMMNGTVKVDSEYGVGTVFTISLSLEIAADIGDTLDVSASGLRGKRVLCVDDLEQNRALLVNRLEHAGMDVFAASSGRAALTLYTLAVETGGPFDAVLIDQTMPDTDSLALAQELHGLDPSLPFILLSTNESEGDQLGREKDLFAGKVAKPIKVEHLLRTLNELTCLRGGRLSVPTREVLPVDVRSDTLGAQMTILIAEDNRTNRMVVEKMLKDQNLSLQFAENGRIAVEMFEKLTPDLVLMDVSMPEMDGYEATEAIRDLEMRTMQKRTTIIALTANAMSGDRELCLARGMDDYLPKPIRKKQLLEMLVGYRAAGAPGQATDSESSQSAPISASR